ncbi:large ribosomal subunit protein bL17m [Monosporozyma servazzii]
MTVGLARKLSRTKPHRVALLKNLVTQLFQHESLITTQEKCKEAARLAERIITSAKKYDHGKGSQRHINNIQSHLFLAGDNKHLLSKVTNELADRYKTRSGGFTRVLKLEPRVGDKGKQATLELLDAPILTNTTLEDGQMSMQRGNIKFWLLMKTLLYDEINDQVYSSMTMKNLVKLYTAKKNDPKMLAQFKEEMLSVRRILMEQMNQTDLKDDPKGRSFKNDPVEESTKVDSIITKLNEFDPTKKSQYMITSKSKYRGNRKSKAGFKIMNTRPERPQIQEQTQ